MSDYVTNDSWVRPEGRPDAIDEIADQFERPVPTPAAAFWTPESTPWPRASRGWRSVSRIHPQPMQERAAG